MTVCGVCFVVEVYETASLMPPF